MTARPGISCSRTSHAQMQEGSASWSWTVAPGVACAAADNSCVLLALCCSDHTCLCPQCPAPSAFAKKFQTCTLHNEITSPFSKWPAPCRSQGRPGMRPPPAHCLGGLDAFSSMPEVPNRCRSSRMTSSIATPWRQELAGHGRRRQVSACMHKKRQQGMDTRPLHV